MSKRTCSVDDCARPHAAKGFCQKHWNRWRIHGDPLVTMARKAHAVQHTSDGLRICKKCQEPKPLTDFHKDKGNPDGYRAQCKPCRNGYMSGYYLANQDARKAYERHRRTNQPEHMRALDMARYERHKEKRILLASDNVRLRRARQAGVESDPKLTVLALRSIDGDYCCYCGVEMTFVRGRRGEGIASNRATLEHILPISRGGTHTFDNAAIACHRCNTSKNRKTVAEWEAWKAGVVDGGEEAVTSRADCGSGRPPLTATDAQSVV